MKIVIPGKPIARKAHKSRIMGKGMHSYDPQADEMRETREYLQSLLDDILQYGSAEIKLDASNLQLAESYHLDVSFYVGVNDSDSNSKRSAKLSNVVPANKKPDIDNCLKFYLDALNKIFIKDDAMVTKCFMYKLYSDQPRVEIEITAIAPEIKYGS